MKKLYQEDLKFIACVTMLVDHIGAVFFPRITLLRCIGRIAFPIYAFLLVEGERHTRSPWKYALRLAVAAILAELPFDLMVFGQWKWSNSSVKVTLLLSFLALRLGRKDEMWKVLSLVAACVLGLWLHSDYGYYGVMTVMIFAWLPEKWLLQGIAIAGLFASMGRISIVMLAGLAVIPIACYNGKKRTNSKAVQWVFYLFYPVHMLLLWWLSTI